MDAKLAQAILAVGDVRGLALLESRIVDRGLLDADVKAALRRRRTELGRRLVTLATGLPLENLSPAEERIVDAISEYAAIKKQQGTSGTRTFNQVRNRGLRGAAEVAVSKARPSQGFSTLADKDLSHLSYEQIVVDHPAEFSERAVSYARRTLGLSSDLSAAVTRYSEGHSASARNPDWARDELILALDLYLRFRGAPPSKDSAEVVELSMLLRSRAGTASGTFRNDNGVYMKLMNFVRLDPQAIADGKAGLPAGSKGEEAVWAEFADDATALAAAVAAIRASAAQG